MRNLHGLCSIIIVAAAVLAALLVIYQRSTGAAVIYLVLVAIASLAILYAYCAKCEARDQRCSHVFPGKLTRWLPQRKAGPYRSMDMLVTGGALAAVFIFPQYWLWHNKVALAVFWGFTIVALLEILLHVCPHCQNRNCMLCQKNIIRN